MRRKVIAGNWKMNNTIEQTKAFMDAFKRFSINDNRTVIFCAPYTSLSTLVETAKGTPIKVGAENMHFEDKGAFTGEISPIMLKELGVEYVIIGHSERRQYFAETDETVNRKIKAALNHDLKPIMCCGESLEQREAGITNSWVKSQVVNGLKDISADDMEKIIIAYEPIWAIGTGKTATSEDANAVCKLVRDTLTELYNKEVADKVIIQYGGSVNSGNAKELFGTSDIDGGLVGGSSLKPDEFIKIVNYEG